jgi:hypothetical protein
VSKEPRLWPGLQVDEGEHRSRGGGLRVKGLSLVFFFFFFFFLVVVVVIESRTLCILGKCFTTELPSPFETGSCYCSIDWLRTQDPPDSIS